MKKLIYSLVLAAVMSIMSGCLSVVGHVGGANCLTCPYDVTGHVAAELVSPTSWGMSVPLYAAGWDAPTKCIFWCGLALDFPFEIVSDTVFLPYDLWMWCSGAERW